MELSFPVIISFSSFCLFTLNQVAGEGDKFPDEGRLVVGKCLVKGLDCKDNEFEEQHDQIYKFCVKTKKNRTFIQDDINAKKLDPDQVYAKMETCLRDKPDLITRYINFIPESVLKAKKPDVPFPKMNQVAVGLCEEKELIKSFSSLDKEDKTEASQCLQKCARGLFKKFETIFANVEKNYEKKLANNEITVKEVDVQDLKDLEENSPEESKAMVQRKPMPRKFQQGVKIQNYIAECAHYGCKEISTLDEIGEKYVRQYIDELDQLYAICSTGVKETKGQMSTTVLSYFACVRWPCAIENDIDVPMNEILEQILSRESEDENNLLND